MKVMLRSAIVLVSLVALVPSPASAQLTDHLKCHKIKDAMQLRATADLLTALQPNYAASGCKISKGTEFCVPVDKQNVQPPPRPDVVGQGLSTDFICYKLKCPGGLGDQVATDQFGTRTLSHLRTNMLCVPAVKGTIPQVTTTTTTSTTTTSLPAGSCCGSQQIVLTTSAGTAKFGVFAPAPPVFFPGGGTITVDAGPADPFPTCRHDAIVPAAGFSLPAFCNNGLFFTHKIIATGCTSGGTDGSGRVWDGVAACADADVSKSADSRDGVCDPDLTACGPGLPFGNNLGDVDAIRGGPCDPAGLNTRIDIPATMIVWADVDGDCPDPDGQYDPGVDSLVEQDAMLLTLTTGTATSVFADKSGPACFIEQNSAGPVGPVSITGAPASGPCCQVGQTATLAAELPVFGGAFPMRDYQVQLSIPATVSSCNAWPGPATCTLPGGCLD